MAFVYKKRLPHWRTWKIKKVVTIIKRWNWVVVCLTQIREEWQVRKRRQSPEKNKTRKGKKFVNPRQKEKTLLHLKAVEESERIVSLLGWKEKRQQYLKPHWIWWLAFVSGFRIRIWGFDCDTFNQHWDGQS